MIALRGGILEPVVFTTSELARDLGISQQSVSLRVRRAVEHGLLTISPFGRSRSATLTQEGAALLEGEYRTYKAIFEGKERVIEIEGRLVTGVGEGSYYIGLEGYRQQFEKILGFTPKWGTLNIQLYPSQKSRKDSLLKFPGSVVEGFDEKERSFGGGRCYRARLADIECGLIIPTRSHYSDILEILSDRNLRDELSLSNGDRIVITVTAL